MTVSAQWLLDQYRAGTEGKNHDGTYQIPADVNDLPSRPRRGWNMTAIAVMDHFDEMHAELQASHKRMNEPYLDSQREIEGLKRDRSELRDGNARKQQALANATARIQELETKVDQLEDTIQSNASVHSPLAEEGA